jgi:hypothetical protein
MELLGRSRLTNILKDVVDVSAALIQPIKNSSLANALPHSPFIYLGTSVSE